VTLKLHELAQKALMKAKHALENEDKSRSRRFAFLALKLDPELDEAWLILAAISSPEDSIPFLRKAFELNPSNQKAIEGMRWASQMIRGMNRNLNKNSNQKKKVDRDLPGRRFKWEIPLFTSVMIVGLIVLCLASIPTFSAQAASHVSARPVGIMAKPTLTPTASPTPEPTPLPSPTPTPTEDTYFSSYTYHSWDIPDEISSGNTFWIEIDLTDQMLYAYRGNQLISGFLVSTGTSSHKTVTGTFKIYAKYPAHRMVGPGYDLDDVPYTMYFYKGYAVHGTYWHHNFGTPMSHGCVNMETSDAAWVYDNAPVGTYIFIHY
jgi:lipoprotein-anchoring transpeptidase ErfK/SrfK